MLKRPELLLDCRADSTPISAVCSACGAQMPLMESKGASPAESNKWFLIKFDLHVRQKHSRQYLTHTLQPAQGTRRPKE